MQHADRSWLSLGPRPGKNVTVGQEGQGLQSCIMVHALQIQYRCSVLVKDNSFRSRCFQADATSGFVGAVVAEAAAETGSDVTGAET